MRRPAIFVCYAIKRRIVLYSQSSFTRCYRTLNDNKDCSSISVFKSLDAPRKKQVILRGMEDYRNWVQDILGLELECVSVRFHLLT